MNRRSFFRRLGALSAGAAVAPVAVEAAKPESVSTLAEAMDMAKCGDVIHVHPPVMRERWIFAGDGSWSAKQRSYDGVTWETVGAQASRRF